ncbi:major facilitator superfamily MFS_1 [Emticicia oligotrophica DSM 17448]|uniref:Major facilitator superfamily MFS_1 n=1 Tax=Emticicia oligotrophica (strain DSM 17448 / CIP 109782 / MTCC 6937 / GPTSA100-15) TaxID=929562 RepID=A0ABM5MXV9_EMTOG|nr:MFS transporter [Emticicia oligotrophica]AFK01971.1 major facilitator superfamily MFS_1 [Emticicia oligotrophica DSM 17448]
MPNKTLLINRIAVSLFFFTNGFLYANWTARLPELQKYFGLNNSELGNVLFCIALGSMIAMPLAGWLGNKFGSDKVVRIVSLLFCVSIPLVAISQNEWIIRLCFLFLGAASGSMDVTMNGQAVLVERLWGKVIFSSFHAVFSIGMAIGAAIGGLFSNFQIPLQTHLTILAILGTLPIFWASTKLLKDSPITESKTFEEKGNNNKFLALKTILPFGIIAFCCMTGEGSMVDWSAIFMNKVVGQNETISAWAFGTFGVAMTIGRVFGDYFTVKLGKEKIMLIDACLAAVGLGIALAFTSIWSTFLGFFLVGLGLSTIVPIVFSSAGNLKNISPSAGISMATSIGYTGFFVGPPTIGYLAEAFGLRIGLSFVFALFILMALIIAILLGKMKSN